MPASSHPAEALRRQHAPAVQANQVRRADRWCQPCRAYSVCIRPGPAAVAALRAVQAGVLRLEPALIQVPALALHASLVWLLPVHQEFGRPKDELWQQHGSRWLTTLAEAAARADSFSLTFRHLVATNSAVITVADEPNPLSALRRELIPLLRLPGSASAGNLAHITLFRYCARLRDPASLLRCIAAASVEVEVEVDELLVMKERVYPSLEYEILQRLALAARHSRERPSSSGERW